VLPDPVLLERCLTDPDWRPGKGDVSRFSGRPDNCVQPDSSRAC
jgi:CRP/FNR family cyclic AMP-dependent transcriptional regulator